MHALIAEHDPAERQRLVDAISGWGYQHTEVADGDSAWQAMESNWLPLIAVLDSHLPGLSCPDICNRARWYLGERSLYIIVITDSGSPEDVTRNLLGGADDCIVGPCNLAELQARVNAGRRVVALRSELAERLRDIGQTLLTIQQSFLLGDVPPHIEGAEIGARSLSLAEVGGDLYDFYGYSRTCFDMLIGDVSGHGITSALVGAATTHRLLHTLREMMVSAGHSGAPDIADVLSQVTHGLFAKYQEMGCFVTACFARFDVAARTMQFVDCGHPKPLFYCAKDNGCRKLTGDNLPLGVLEHEAFVVRDVTFAPGDVFLFYTDGITETRDMQGEFYGEERLASLLWQHHDLPPKALVDTILDDLTAYAKGGVLTDDATCMAVRITG